MDDLLSPPLPFDGTTSTPCISTASSFVTASSYCDDIFQFDPFSEPLEIEVGPYTLNYERQIVVKLTISVLVLKGRSVRWPKALIDAALP